MPNFPSLRIEIPCSISALYTLLSAPLASKSTKFAFESNTSNAPVFLRFYMIFFLSFLINEKIVVILFDFSKANIPH